MTIVATLDAAIRNTTSAVSIVLALLVLFTDRRARGLEGWQREPHRTSRAVARWAIALDCALVLATLVLLVSISPLALDAARHLAIGHERGALRGLFVLIWLGLLAVSGLQLWIVRARVLRYRDLRWP